MDNTCHNCRYIAIFKRSNDNWYECRRYPPLAFGDSKSYGGTSFPATSPERWCGEFKKKVIKKENKVLITKKSNKINIAKPT